MNDRRSGTVRPHIYLCTYHYKFGPASDKDVGFVWITVRLVSFLWADDLG